MRSLREDAQIGLRELSRRVGCSPGLISQIEHGLVTPSVATLYAITRELDVPVDALFAELDGSSVPARRRARADDAEHDTVCEILRSGQRTTMDLPNGVRWNLLAAGDTHHVQFREIVYEPGAMSTPPGEMVRHPGHEHGVVIEGSFGMQVEEETLLLEPNDSIAFSASRPHRLWNPGTAPARAIWFINEA